MNKKIILTILGLAFASYLGTVYINNRIDSELAQRNLTQFNSLSKFTLNYQAMKILTEKGCAYCHTSNSALPFYSNLPIAKQLMQEDVIRGLRHFDMTHLFRDVQNKNPISETALARIEKVLKEGSMPPSLYLSMHWSATVSNEDLQILAKWIVEARTERHANSPVSEIGKFEVVQPIYTKFETDSGKVELGKILYHDTRLSGDNSISCASCHNLATGGVDRLRASIGIHGQVGGINAPTVFNAAYNKHQFWDGRANDLQEQAGGPPFNPVEMGSTGWDQIINKLSQDKQLVAMFTASYDGEINGDTITDAIAEFEKTLVTPNSRFDQYLMGNTQALTSQEQHGFALFKKFNCHTCHAGEAMGGETFETMGMKADYFANRGTNITDADFGRYNFTKNEQDKYKFKVPTLRNIALTSPYFHDGHADTLEKAIYDMGKYQVGVEISNDEVDAIRAFLYTLTGELNGQPLAQN